MHRKVVGMAGLRTPGETGWRTDDHPTSRTACADRNHVGLEAFAKPQACVAAAFDEILANVRGTDIKLDPRVKRAEGW